MRAFLRLCVALLVLPGLPAVPAAAQDITVVVVRHAEKADTTRDPALSLDGRSRAHALAASLADAGIEAIYTTQYQRTRQTAEPLAALLGIQVQTVEAGGDVRAHARTVADRVLSSGARAALVVGHSNTVPAIVEALGAPAVRPIADHEHAHMFVVAIRNGEVRLLKATF